MMNQNKKILEVCFSPDLGGLELYMVECANELKNEFSVLSIIAQNTKLDSFLNSKQLPYLTLKRKSSFSLIQAWKLAKIIDENSIDIVHIHWTKDIPIAVLAKLFSKKNPKIVQTRHMTMTRFKNDFYHNFLYKNIDTILCVTKAVQEQIKKFIPQKIRPKLELLYLGAKNAQEIKQEEIEQLKQELNAHKSFIVGLIGRINEFKGQHLLIEAMNQLTKKSLNIKAFIIGHAMDEGYLLKLKQKVSDENLNNCIKFVGFTKEVGKFMKICDTILMTSKNETFGLVTVEAMKNGVAVIGSNQGGTLEIIDDQKSGLLFESGNAQDLASKIEMLYHNENLKNQLALSGQIKANEMFDKTVQFEKLKNVIHKI
jgi:L-malate glycosyltransferase